MADSVLGKIIVWFYAIAFLVINSACTREIGKSAQITLTLPGGSQSFQNKGLRSLSTIVGVSSGSTAWTLSDPVDINDVGCFAILIEGTSPVGAPQSCSTQANIRIANPWMTAGTFVAGSTIQLSVPSGAGRKINLVGFKAANPANCLDLTSGPGLDRANMSAPFIVGSKTVDLAANANTTVEIFASMTGATKFDSCSNWTAPSIAAPSLSVLDASVYESAGSAYIPVTLSSVASSQIEFQLTAVGGTATYNSDYTSQTFTGSIAAGASVHYVEVPIVNDMSIESTETIYFSLSPITATPVLDPIGIVSIADDDGAMLYIQGTTVTEGMSANVLVSLNHSTNVPVTFSIGVDVAGSSATYGQDYTSLSFQGSIAAGSLSTTVAISTVNDLLNEDVEAMNISLTSIVNAGPGVAAAFVTINDNDSPPVIYANDFSTPENAGQTSVTVTISAPSGRDVTLNYMTFAGSATDPTDYGYSAGILTITKGQLATAVVISLADDSIFEGNETFLVSLSNPVNVSPGQLTAIGTIIDDESSPQLVVLDSSSNESGTLSFGVNLSNASAQTITVNYNTSDGDANSGVDYVAKSGVLTFAPGEVSATIAIQVIDDNLQENSESFNVNLVSPSNANIIDGIGVGTILANDVPNLFVSDASAPESIGNMSFNVYVDTVPNADVVFSYSTLNGTALAGADFAAVSNALLTITAGTTSTNALIAIVNDSIHEGNQNFVVTLTGLSNANPGDLSATGLIIDNESAPYLYVVGFSTTEGFPATVAVSMTFISEANITFNYTTSPLTALGGNIDFQSISGNLTIPAGSLSVSQAINTYADYTVESNETFAFTISLPTNSILGNGSGVLTINDGDGWRQQSFLKAINRETNDEFGRNVAIDRDYIVVGAVNEASTLNFVTNGTGASANNAAAGAGAAYVFKRTASNWVQTAYLKASNVSANDHFGSAVEIYDDLIAISAADEDSNQTTISAGTTSSADNSATSSGAVYIFKRSGLTWVQDAYIKASNSGASDNFGSELALYGDTLAVSAINEDSNQSTITNGATASANNTLSASGAVYVYLRTGGVWVQQAYIKAANPDASEMYGVSLALDGNTLVVGSEGEDSAQSVITNGPTASADNSSINSGAAYVYRRSGVVWAQEAFLKAANNDQFDTFGSGVAIHGDTIVVGAYGESSSQSTVMNFGAVSFDNSQASAGAAYVFHRTINSWNLEAYLKAPNAMAGHYFGSAVGLWGNVAVVGASEEQSNSNQIINGTGANYDNTGFQNGAAYIFRRTSNTWVQEAYLKGPNTGLGDEFAMDVKIDGDTVVAGAQWEDSNSPLINGTSALMDDSFNNSGAAYVFINGGPLTNVVYQHPTQTNPAGSLPIKFIAQFSRAIVSGTFTTSDIFNIGTATGVVWTITNPTGDARTFELTATSGSSGTYVPHINAGTVNGADGSSNQSSIIGFDNSVTY